MLQEENMLKKKLSKIALLTAAAFMLAGLPACSGDDGDGNEGEYSPTVERKITLYKNGESQGEKDSVAAALAAIPTSGTDVWEIKLMKGTYTESEQLTYNGSATVRITGETDAAYGSDVIIKGVGSDYTTESGRSMFEIRGSGNTILKNIRMEHIDMMKEHPYIGSDGKEHKSTQREVIGHQSKGTLAAYNCSFISRQDTIRTESKAWFYKCYIEGDVDFLWIEQSTKASKAALYEDCELYAVGDRKDKAYFTAPRLPVTNEVGKGLVIWKSRLKADERLKEVYLGRNPWDKETDENKKTDYFEKYYENVAVVDSEWSGKALDSKVWSGSGAHGTDDQQFVGFKTCQKFPAPSNNCGAAVLTAEQVEAEYSNRNYILNRVYNIEKAQFENDYPIWNLSALETEFGTERSEALPVSPTIIVWEGANLQSTSDALIQKGDFADNKTYLLGAQNATMSFYVVSNCTVTVSLFYSGEASVACNGKSVNGKIKKNSQTESIVLELTGIDTPKKVTVTALANNTYIESVKVKYATNVEAKLAELKTKLEQSIQTYDFTDAFDTWLTNTCNSQMTKAHGNQTYSGATLSVTTDNGNFKYDRNNKCMTSTGGQIVIPVSGACTVTVTCHDYNSTYIKLNDTSLTSTAKSLVYDYTGSGGNITISSSDTSKTIYIYTVKVEYKI